MFCRLRRCWLFFSLILIVITIVIIITRQFIRRRKSAGVTTRSPNNVQVCFTRRCLLSVIIGNSCLVVRWLYECVVFFWCIRIFHHYAASQSVNPLVGMGTLGFSSNPWKPCLDFSCSTWPLFMGVSTTNWYIVDQYVWNNTRKYAAWTCKL